MCVCLVVVVRWIPSLCFLFSPFSLISQFSHPSPQPQPQPQPLQASTSENGEAVHSYACVESDDGAFLAGRRADVMYDGAKIGSFGIVHPTVLANFELDFPCSYLEINVEALLVQ